MKLYQKSLFFSVFVSAILLPAVCSANNGLKALGEVMAEIIGILAVSLLVSLIFTIGNLVWKNKIVRIISVILLLPQLALALFMLILSGGFFFSFFYLGLVGLLFIAFQLFLIYKSIKK